MMILFLLKLLQRRSEKIEGDEDLLNSNLNYVVIISDFYYFVADTVVLDDYDVDKNDDAIVILNLM